MGKLLPHRVVGLKKLKTGKDIYATLGPLKKGWDKNIDDNTIQLRTQLVCDIVQLTSDPNARELSLAPFVLSTWSVYKVTLALSTQMGSPTTFSKILGCVDGQTG